MKAKLKKIFTNTRILILLVALVLAIVAIHPNPAAEGVAIRSVTSNSSAAEAGIESPEPDAPPMSRERVVALNGRPIEGVEDYYDIVNTLPPDTTVSVLTNEQSYKLQTREQVRQVVLNETTEKTVTRTRTVNRTVNGSVMQVNRTFNETIVVNKTRNISEGTEELGLNIYEAPNTNIRKGLDLEGGTRVVLKPKEKLSPDMMEALIANLKQRLNIYGLSDVVVRTAGDLVSDAQYIVVEISGSNVGEVKELLSQQGKFEAKIGDKLVFSGAQDDITYVCRSADCSGIDPYRGCSQTQDGKYACRFRFSISLSPEAAERHAEVTGQLDTVTVDQQGNYLSQEDQYLNKTLDLYLDNEQVDSLRIGADLKGREESSIQISGSGAAETEQRAQFNALENMKHLQTILVTGSLPAEIEIVRSETLSAQMGESFIKDALLIGALAILAVALVVFARYRRREVFVPMVITMLSELALILGIASLIGWNLDLAAIAGIIIALGTGVDDQIVITDETLHGERAKSINWKTKLKNAFVIIMVAYVTTVAAMVPLLFAGAGMLKGFAITTLIGITVGVFITRPAFGEMIDITVNE